jgi:hypothetical protein
MINVSSGLSNDQIGAAHTVIVAVVVESLVVPSGEKSKIVVAMCLGLPPFG